MHALAQASVQCCLHSVLVGWLVHYQSTRPLACVGIFQQSAQLHKYLGRPQGSHALDKVWQGKKWGGMAGKAARYRASDSSC